GPLVSSPAAGHFTEAFTKGSLSSDTQPGDVISMPQKTTSRLHHELFSHSVAWYCKTAVASSLAIRILSNSGSRARFGLEFPLWLLVIEVENTSASEAACRILFKASDRSVSR